VSPAFRSTTDTIRRDSSLRPHMKHEVEDHRPSKVSWAFNIRFVFCGTSRDQRILPFTSGLTGHMRFVYLKYDHVTGQRYHRGLSSPADDHQTCRSNLLVQQVWGLDCSLPLNCAPRFLGAQPEFIQYRLHVYVVPCLDRLSLRKR
jgi:hypothetical protein